MKQPSVNVCMPCRGPMHPSTAFSLLALVDRGRRFIRDVKHRNFLYIDEARNQLVAESISDSKATHTLWLDADMVWEPDTVERLLAHQQFIVGATYFRKAPPHDHVAGDWVNDSARGNFAPLPDMKPGLRRVGAVGMGCTLIDNELFRQMSRWFRDDQWFRSLANGEDLWFCGRCLALDVPVHLDGDLFAGHIVEQVVTQDHWQACHGQMLTSAQPEACDFADLYREAVESFSQDATSVAVELGSWLGSSAIVMANLIEESNKHVRFVCVDHFRGSAEEGQQLLAKQSGGSFRCHFDANLRRAGVLDHVEVIEGDSADSAARFENGSVDFCFIDAGHDRASVERDVLAWTRKIKRGGMMAGHDYDWPEVRDAVKHLLPTAQPVSAKCWRWRPEWGFGF